MLAFRLSSIKGEFPSIVTQRGLVKESKDRPFKKLGFSKEERLKYFKDEAWGINEIYISSDRPHRKHGTGTAVKQMKSALALERKNGDRTDFIDKLVDELEAGPEWCQEVWKMWSNLS